MTTIFYSIFQTLGQISWHTQSCVNFFIEPTYWSLKWRHNGHVTAVAAATFCYVSQQEPHSEKGELNIVTRGFPRLALGIDWLPHFRPRAYSKYAVGIFQSGEKNQVICFIHTVGKELWSNTKKLHFLLPKVSNAPILPVLYHITNCPHHACISRDGHPL